MICHAEGCEQRIQGGMLMCNRHWFTVPKVIRLSVWAAWRNGAGMGTPEHELAKLKAILYVAVKEGRITQQEATDRLGQEIEV